MTKENEKKKDLALDYIRAIAMLMIAFCHFFQILHSLELAFWLNIGVQIFLVLSAKLLQKKSFNTKRDALQFYKTRVVRIMLPVWIYLIAICTVLVVIQQPPSWISVIAYALGGAAFVKNGILGLGHFWYLTIILIAYLLTPVLAIFAKRMKEARRWIFVSILVMISLGLVSIFWLIATPAYGVHLSLFIVAYYLFQRQEQDRDWAKNGVKYVFIPMILSVAGRIACTIVGVEAWKYYTVYDALCIPIFKAVQGYWLFCALYCLFSQEKCRVFPKAIEKLSVLSFEIYITHQFIELAVYEYVPYCNSGTILGGMLMFVVSAVLIAINTVVLHYLVDLARKGGAKLKR